MSTSYYLQKPTGDATDKLSLYRRYWDGVGRADHTRICSVTTGEAAALLRTGLIELQREDQGIELPGDDVAPIQVGFFLARYGIIKEQDIQASHLVMILAPNEAIGRQRIFVCQMLDNDAEMTRAAEPRIHDLSTRFPEIVKVIDFGKSWQKTAEVLVEKFKDDVIEASLAVAPLHSPKNGAEILAWYVGTQMIPPLSIFSYDDNAFVATPETVEMIAPAQEGITQEESERLAQALMLLDIRHGGGQLLDPAYNHSRACELLAIMGSIGKMREMAAPAREMKP